MSLVTTAGATNADSYAALVDADAYFAARGETAWTGSDTVKENALRRATTYIDNNYRTRWIGMRTNQTQSLAWPRVDGSMYRQTWLYDVDGWQIDSDVIPQQVARATMESALLIIQGVTMEPRLARGGQIKSESKSVGPLSKSTTYMDGAPVRDQFTAIDGLLRGLVNGAANARVVRG